MAKKDVDWQRELTELEELARVDPDDPDWLSHQSHYHVPVHVEAVKERVREYYAHDRTTQLAREKVSAMFTDLTGGLNAWLDYNGRTA